MTLGVREYGNSLLVQNVFDPDKIPDVDPSFKAFAYKILTPSVLVVEDNCKTTIGRVLPIPEINPVGLIKLSDTKQIVDQDVIDSLSEGKFIMRTRDTNNCVSDGGVCSLCSYGYNARYGSYETPRPGAYLKARKSPIAYLNYLASTYSGALAGYSKLNDTPLPALPRYWDNITNHTEMDRLCVKLKNLKVSVDELEYLYTIEDVLERALLIINVYGVYASVQ